MSKEKGSAGNPIEFASKKGSAGDPMEFASKKGSAGDPMEFASRKGLFEGEFDFHKAYSLESDNGIFHASSFGRMAAPRILLLIWLWMMQVSYWRPTSYKEYSEEVPFPRSVDVTIR